MVSQRLLLRARHEFAQAFARGERPHIAAAPGRVNLIGEHTDYNDGFVLPMAIDRHVAVAFLPREDRVLRAYASEFGETRELSLDGLERRTTTEPDRRSTRGGWFGYVAGVAWAMLGAGHALGGADLAIAGEVPPGAGLSSSAALEIAVARALGAVAKIPWEPAATARLAQLAEQEFAGVSCGIMDQLSVASARKGCALLLDCRSLETRDVPIPSTARILVFDSGVRRELTRSAYNERRASCERVVAALRKRHAFVRALRDADDALLAEVAASLDAVDVRRASHVIAENRRPALLADAFAAGNLERAGRLMMHSHGSLRDLYEVSSPELDILVELAIEQPGCTGARLTGAGFGGCVIALVEAGSVERVLSSVEAGYEARTGRPTAAFACVPSEGARVLPES
jgi:galactokinase